MAVRPYYVGKGKKKVKWRFTVDVPSGEFDKHGRPKRKQIKREGFNRKCDAEEAERNFLNEIEDVCPVTINPDIQTKFVINSFIDYTKNEGKYANGTIKNYEGYRDNHLTILMEVPIKNLTPNFIHTAWRRKLYQKGVSDHVYNGCLKLLKRSFEYCIELKQLKVNPFADLKSVDIMPKLRNRFSIDELTRVIDICFYEMPEFYCIFLLACLSGMRLGEYSAIRPCDIRKHSNHYVVYVDKQITRNEYKDRTKTHDSTRIVDISDMIYKQLQWYIDKYNIPHDDFLFRADKGGMLYAKWVERKFEKLLKLCGYEEDFCRVHDLRGQYVDVMHLIKTPVTYISRQVGHKNPIVTTKVYTQILNELPEEANKKMDNLIFGKKDEKANNIEGKTE